jgi:hypothetical protein
MAANATSSGPSALPDLNAQTYPYYFVQHLLDETADANLLCVPRRGTAERAVLTAKQDDYFGLNGGYGLAIRSDLKRFGSVAHTGTGEQGLIVRESTGETVGSLSSLWLFGPADLAWAPGAHPAPAILDPWRSQRFAMLDTHFDFGEHHGFSGYGIGRTFPVSVGGRPRVMAGAVGNVMQGHGKFSGLEGTFVITGDIVELGFLGNITIRLIDPDRMVRTERQIESPVLATSPETRSTFVVMRGVKKDSSVKTTYGPPPADGRVNLVTPSVMRSLDVAFDTSGSGPHANITAGPPIADMTAEVLFDLLAAPGNAQHPVPFTTREVYSFHSCDGVFGTVNAGVTDGIAFDLKFPEAPGQPGVRFAGFGPITGGTGSFEGAQGILTVNSTIGISPHALSLIHVLHLADDSGRFRRSSRRW